MSPRYTVEEYMQQDVVSIETTASLRQAMQLMIDRNVNSLVIVDASKKVMGMLSSIDVIAYVVPDYLEEDRHLAAFESGDVFTERVKAVGGESVTKSMSAHVQTVQPSDTLIEAAALLSEHRINQLPVVNAQGQLIGYIGRSNIKKAIGDVFTEHPS